jgi:hypothetical protein
LEVPKLVSNFALSGLLSKEAIRRQFRAKTPSVL